MVVDPNRRASDGSTPLHALVALRSRSAVETLVERRICQLLLDHGAKDENPVLDHVARNNRETFGRLR